MVINHDEKSFFNFYVALSGDKRAEVNFRAFVSQYQNVIGKKTGFESIGQLQAFLKKYGTEVNYLNLSGYAINDDNLKKIIELAPNLKGINLNTCDKITDASLKNLTELKYLTQLDLSRCIQITDKGLGHLAAYKQLAQLYLSGCKQITDIGLSHLAAHKQLALLDLADCDKITADGRRYKRDLIKKKKGLVK